MPTTVTMQESGTNTKKDARRLVWQVACAVMFMGLQQTVRGFRVANPKTVTEGATGSNSTAPSSPVPFEGGPCGSTPTSLGYQCSFTTPDAVTIHWSNGTALPKNPCTQQGTGTFETAQNPPKNFMHFAAQVELPEGRLELAFPEVAGDSYPAEVAYGFSRPTTADPPGVRGSAFTMFRANARDKTFTGAWAAYKGAYRSNDTRILTVCFSRLRLSKGMTTGQNQSEEIKLTWAAYTKTEPHGTAFQKPVKAGGAVVDVATGRVLFVQSNKPTIAIVHGVLMLLSFGVLLPAGTLLARHRWIFKHMEAENSPVWLLAHLGTQLLGFLTGLGGIIIMLVTFGNKDPGSSWWRSHQVLGICTLGLAVLQFFFGLMRPDSGTKAHGSWFRLHSNLGRAICISAIANVFIGTTLMHDIQGMSYMAWMVPAVLVSALLLLAALALEVKMVELQRSGQFMTTSFAVAHRRGSQPGILGTIRTRPSGSNSSGTFGEKVRLLAHDVADAIGSPLASPGSMDLYQRKRRSTAGVVHSAGTTPTAASSEQVLISYL